MTDAETGATPLSIVKEGLKNGESFQSIIDGMPHFYTDALMGNVGGSLGKFRLLHFCLEACICCLEKLLLGIFQ